MRPLADHTQTHGIFSTGFGNAFKAAACAPLGAGACTGNVGVGILAEDQQGKFPTHRVPEIEFESQAANLRGNRGLHIKRNRAHVQHSHDGTRLTSSDEVPHQSCQ